MQCALQFLSHTGNLLIKPVCSILNVWSSFTKSWFRCWIQLTNSMEQSCAWEANEFSDGQEAPIFYGKQRFITLLTRAQHLSVYESIAFHQSCHFKINFNNEAPHTPRPSCGLFLSGFPTKILFAFLFFPSDCYMPNPSPYPLLDYPNNIL